MNLTLSLMTGFLDVIMYMMHCTRTARRIIGLALHIFIRSSTGNSSVAGFRPAEEVIGRSRTSQLLCPSKTVVDSREGVGINVIDKLRWKSDRGLFRRPD